jgi:hypothetical protein
MITALAIMLAIAGYLQFAGTNPTEDVEANSNHLENGVKGTITEIFTVEDDLFSDISDIDSLDTDGNEFAPSIGDLAYVMYPDLNTITPVRNDIQAIMNGDKPAYGTESKTS